MTPFATEVVHAALRDLAHRYLKALGNTKVFIALGMLAVGTLAIPPVRRLIARKASLAPGIALALVMAAACAWAWALSWASDDAYISFRYADNLAHGRGLVFNPGERVEGYTNFLWTLLMAGAIRLGIHPGHAGILLSLSSFVLLLGLLERMAKRLVPTPPLPIGIGPLLAAFNYTLASFATSGLETMFAAMLVLFALDRAETRRPVAAGLAGVAAAMSHPDHLIFYAAIGAALLADSTRRRELLRYAAPFVLVLVPYFVWRWSYYGDFWPNTYYVKSADKAYFDQGIVYLATTFVAGGLSVVLPLAVVGAHGVRQTLISRFSLVAIPIYLVYVAKIGGDFMLGRLFTPVLAVSFLLADVGFRTLLARRRWILAWTLGAVAALAAVPAVVVRPGEVFFGIADERTFTPLERFATMEVSARGYELGQVLRRDLAERGLFPKVALFSLGMASYPSRLPVFDLRGLTSQSVAHLPIRKRGRPGHEKQASLGLVLAAQVELSEMPVYPPPYDRLSKLSLSGFSFHLVRHQPDLVTRLPNSARLVDFQRAIDASLPALQRKLPARAACDLWHMKEYYFAVNDDASRRVAVERAAVLADPTLSGVESLLLETRDLAEVGWQRVKAFSFEAGEPAWTSSGEGGAFPREAVLPDQAMPFGQEGQFVNTFTVEAGDRARGSLVSPDFVVVGDVATFRIGGGLDPARLKLALIVEGVAARHATGCESEWLDARVWDLRPFRGKTAHWLVLDDAMGRWGHLSVDEIVEWRAPDGASGQ